MELTKDEIVRYSRQIALPEVGGAGQEKLRAARVLIVGAGGLGSPAALYLAAAGVGTIGIADPDTVQLSDLGRQIIHTTAAVGSPKVESAASTLGALNPLVNVEAYAVNLDDSNAEAIVARYDLVIDGTDNYEARYVLNDCCVRLGKPLCHGAVLGFEGQATTILPGRSPCYRCIYPRPPGQGAIPSCRDAGVLGSVPGLIGAVQATEAMKVILGIGEPLSGRLLVFDALAMEMRVVQVHSDPGCPACGPLSRDGKVEACPSV
jgi:adenylyltransferase/sulfurtransferase